MVIEEKTENEKRMFPHLYDVVIKQQPEAVALDNGDVVSPVGTTAAWRQTGGKTSERRCENKA